MATRRHVKLAKELPGGGVGDWTLLPMDREDGCTLGLEKEFYEPPVKDTGPDRRRRVVEGTLVRGRLRTALSRFTAATILDMIFKRVAGDLEGYRVAQVSPVETITYSGVKVGKARIERSEVRGQRSGTEIFVEMELLGLSQALGAGGSEPGYAAEVGYTLNFATFLVDGEAPATVEGFAIEVDNGLAQGPFGADGRMLWLIGGRRTVRAEVILRYESGMHSQALVNGTRGVFRVVMGRPAGLPGASATIELPAAIVTEAPLLSEPGEAVRQRVGLVADVDEEGVDVGWGVE
jgi:hypothetical protein